MVFDGTMELIFALNNGFSMVFDNTRLDFSSGIHVGGQINQRMALQLQPSTKLLFFKIPPQHLHLLSGDNLHTLLNSSVSLANLNPQLNRCLRPRLYAHPLTILDALDSYFEHCHADEFNTVACSKFIDLKSPYQTQKQQLLVDTGLSQRGFEQKFKRRVGISPKQFSRLLKLRALTERLQFQTATCRLTDIAHEFGFFDQSHFNHSMRAFLGQTPGKIDYDRVFVPNSAEALRFFTIES